MGRIADADSNGDFDVDDDWRFTNKVDTILGQLDDADRGVVLSWLLSDLGEEHVEARLRRHRIRCSDSTIRRWRAAQSEGVGRPWAA